MGHFGEEAFLGEFLSYFQTLLVTKAIVPMSITVKLFQSQTSYKWTQKLLFLW